MLGFVVDFSNRSWKNSFQDLSFLGQQILLKTKIGNYQERPSFKHDLSKLLTFRLHFLLFPFVTPVRQISEMKRRLKCFTLRLVFCLNSWELLEEFSQKISPIFWIVTFLDGRQQMTMTNVSKVQT